MRVLVIGAGAIGSALVRACAQADHEVLVVDQDPQRAKEAGEASGATVVTDPDAEFYDIDLVVEAASVEAVRQWALPALQAGADVLVMSVSALADEELLSSLQAGCVASGADLHVPSGAIAGLDGVKALAGEPGARATLTTRKPPRGLGVDVSEPTLLFEGDYKAAVQRFPRNVNIAAAIALAGIPPTVRIYADPGVARNTHELEVETDRHRMTVRVESDPSEANPATSDLAVKSALRLLSALDGGVRVGT